MLLTDHVNTVEEKTRIAFSFFWVSLEEWSQGTNDDSQDSVRSEYAAIWYTLAGTAPTVFKCPRSDKTQTYGAVTV